MNIKYIIFLILFFIISVVLIYVIGYYVKKQNINKVKKLNERLKQHKIRQSENKNPNK